MQALIDLRELRSRRLRGRRPVRACRALPASRHWPVSGSSGAPTSSPPQGPERSAASAHPRHGEGVKVMKSQTTCWHGAGGCGADHVRRPCRCGHCGRTRQTEPSLIRRIGNVSTCRERDGTSDHACIPRCVFPPPADHQDRRLSGPPVSSRARESLGPMSWTWPALSTTFSGLVTGPGASQPGEQAWHRPVGRTSRGGILVLAAAFQMRIADLGVGGRTPLASDLGGAPRSRERSASWYQRRFCRRTPSTPDPVGSSRCRWVALATMSG